MSKVLKRESDDALVEAMKLSVENKAEVADWSRSVEKISHYIGGQPVHVVYVNTPHGVVTAEIGDTVIRIPDGDEHEGQFDVVKADDLDIEYGAL